MPGNRRMDNLVTFQKLVLHVNILYMMILCQKDSLHLQLHQLCCNMTRFDTFISNKCFMA